MKGYAETTLRGVIRRAGGKADLQKLRRSDLIAHKLFKVEDQWIKELFRKGYSEVGELNGEEIWQYAYDICEICVD